MTKPPRLSSMSDEFAGLVAKGQAFAVPAAAAPPVELPPPAPVSAPEPKAKARKAPRPAPIEEPRPWPAPMLGRDYEPKTATPAKVQVGLRLNPDRYEQLRRIVFDTRRPMQTIIEDALIGWMDYFESQQRRK